MTKNTQAHLGLLANNLFFAINIGSIKHFTANDFAGPYGLNIIRIGVCVLLFWILFVLNSGNKLQRKDLLRFLLCSLSALAINQMLFMKGLSYTYSIHASLLLLISPILITFIAAWVLKERLGYFKIAGLIMGIIGATILITTRESTGNGDNILLGDLLIILSAVAYTFYFILVKPLMLKYPAMDVMRWVFTFGLFMIIPLGWKEFTHITWHQFGTLEYVLLFLIVIPGTFLAYIFNVYGIKILGASVAGTYIYSQPFFGVLIATIFLNEQFTVYKIIAAVFIFAGVFFANKQVKTKEVVAAE